MRDCGVPFAQGYLFTRPQSAAAIEELVFRERPFGSLLAPPPMLLGFEFDGDEPAIELGAPGGSLGLLLGASSSPGASDSGGST